MCPPPDTSARLSRCQCSSPLVSYQSDLIYQSVYELIHADDRAAFRRQLHRAPASGSTQHAADGECQGDPWEPASHLCMATPCWKTLLVAFIATKHSSVLKNIP